MNEIRYASMAPARLHPLRLPALPPACNVDTLAIGLCPHLLALRHPLIDIFDGLAYEELWTFLVDHEGFIFAAAREQGDEGEAPVPFRKLSHWAIQSDAQGMLLAHNHPSGNPAPSSADIEITRSWATLCRLMGWVLWDHIIVGGDACFSFREAGLM